MKYIFVILFALVIYSTCPAQGLSGADMQKIRIEQAVKAGDFNLIEDMFSNSMTIRLDDSLYQDVSCITALDLLNKYFEDKGSIKFRMSISDNGDMTYVQNGEKKKVHVDMFFKIENNNIVIRDINFSNYPTPTMFYKNRKS
ncbi:MAG: hypothetical protein Q8903_11370 [Bacteroidota bacterium]|nr:hypothetical protein [Bacteroidota bacterium]